MTVEKIDNLEELTECNVCGSSNISKVAPEQNICQCTDCGFVFDNPRPTLDAIAAFYSKPTQYDDWLSESDDRDGLWQRRLDKLSSTRQPGSLLDIGTGIGQFLYNAKPHYNSVCGTEVSESAIDIARTKYGIEAIKGSIEQIDFGDRKFDNITIFHVLEHVHDPRSVVQKCYNLRDDGGVFIIAVPNDIQGLKDNIKPIIKKSGGWGFLPKIVLDGSVREIHLSHFTPSVLCRLVESCGFKVLENSLDPYYANNSLLNNTWYSINKSIHFVTGLNYYDTIWIVARKTKNV